MTLSRRTLLTAGAALGLGGMATGPAHATPSRWRGLAVGDTAFVDVAAATLWCDATIDGVAKRAWEVPRPGIDDPALTNPAGLRDWNANMQATELRAWLSGNGVLETQGVMGTRVIVTELHGDWAKVIVPAQPTPRADGTFEGVNGYPGWVPARQLVRSRTFARAFAAAPLATVTSPHAWLSKRSGRSRRTTELSFNTVLPVVDRDRGAVRVLRPDGNTEWLRASDVVVRRSGVSPRRPTGEQVVATGKKLLGIRYLWAGVSSYGFDCSGFTYTCYRHHGITLNRDANPQMWYSGGRVIEPRELTPDRAADADAYNIADWRPADLVFFGRRRPNGLLHADHVGMCTEAGSPDPLIIHSPNSSASVQLERFSQILDGGRVAVGIRRYL